jgi:hypothetical protein
MIDTLLIFIGIALGGWAILKLYSYKVGSKIFFIGAVGASITFVLICLTCWKYEQSLYYIPDQEHKVALERNELIRARMAFLKNPGFYTEIAFIRDWNILDADIKLLVQARLDKREIHDSELRFLIPYLNPYGL